jgi:nicotinate-nucleotide adenylyltransferase
VGLKRRIGVFGGSFDPPHNAHVALARTALDALQLDEVCWIPAGAPWQKTRDMTPAADREAMVRLVIEGEPHFTLDRCEIERGGPTYTIDTVRELQAARPDATWCLLVGQDQYAGLHTWRDWQDLLGQVVLAVANRPGMVPEVHPDVLAFPHQTVPLPMLDISSTDIRQRVAQGLSIHHLVPPEVARYIADHSLYKDAAAH